MCIGLAPCTHARKGIYLDSRVEEEGLVSHVLGGALIQAPMAEDEDPSLDTGTDRGAELFGTGAEMWTPALSNKIYSFMSYREDVF